MQRLSMFAAIAILWGSSASAGLFDAFGQKVQAVLPGMSEAQVVQTLGRADGFKTEARCKTLSYLNRLLSLWAWDRADYYVVVCGDKVTEIGTTAVRQVQRPSSSLILIPIQPER